MTPRASAAPYRIAGVVYLVLIAAGLSSEAVFRAPLSGLADLSALPGGADGAAAALRAALLLDTLMALSDVVLGALLLVILRPAGEALALMAFSLRLVQAAVLGAGLVLHHGAALALDGGAAAGLAPFLLSLHAHAYDMGLVFFGGSCLATGVLLLRHPAFPAALGWGIGAAGIVYLSGSALRFLAPGLSAGFAPAYMVPLVAELALALWLVFGARGRVARARPAAA
ncbi:DUF4386 domain-containing protein [Rhodosalinus sp. K401]|uniref:DUF4386 domain-containing protein n=1 Tax=Rhodosalinus sp. K401 TaxID=3239195 RepID=UPI0035265CD7